MNISRVSIRDKEAGRRVAVLQRGEEAVEKCSNHDDLVAAAAKGTALDEERGKQLDAIFHSLREIRTAIDQNQVRAESRDVAIVAVKNCIETVDRKIENGLRSEIRKILSIVDKRAIEREEAAGKGFVAFLTPGIKEFKNKLSFILVTGFFISLLWLALQTVGKMAIGDVAKFFGIGS